MDLDLLRCAAFDDAFTMLEDEPRETWLTADRWRMPQPHRSWLDAWLDRPASGGEWEFYRCHFGFALWRGVAAIRCGADTLDVEAAVREKTEPEPVMTRRKKRGPRKAKRF